MTGTSDGAKQGWEVRRQNGRDKLSAKQRRTLFQARNPEDKEVYQARDIFRSCRQSAQRRGILFLLTFDDWYSIWQQSGHWTERGCHKGQYVMARYGDEGPYAVDNVRIVTVEENHAEKWARPEMIERAIERGKKLGRYARR